MDKKRIKALVGLVVLAILIHAVALYIDYTITNDFLSKMGFDKLSFFQVSVLGAFTRLMVGAPTFVEPILEQMQKQYKDNLSTEDQITIAVKRAFMSLFFNGVAYIVYVMIVVPKFFYNH